MSEGPRTGGRAVGGVGALAIGVLVAAWALGSTALAILGLGLGLAAVSGRVWAWRVSRALAVERRPVGRAAVEGEPLRLRVALHGRPWLASRVELRDRVGPLGERRIALRRGENVLEVEAAPRGRYRLGPGRLLVDDPLGLSRVELQVAASGTVLVRPRVPVLPRLFTDSGGRGGGGLGRPVRRASGLDPHGVREYVEGEPLRAVHWPTSARRGELMVRELEDAPRDGVAVVLDVERSAIAGPPGDSSLDEAVRAAAGLVRAHVSRANEVLLVIGTPAPELHRVRGLGLEWERALDALAAAEGVDGTPLRALLGTSGLLRAATEVVVVTARADLVADALAVRASPGRAAALVAVDAPTYAGRPPGGASPALLRVAASGVPVAVLRHGVPLEEALGALEARAVG